MGGFYHMKRAEDEQILKVNTDKENDRTVKLFEPV